jgi:hypothetical protein
MEKFDSILKNEKEKTVKITDVLGVCFAGKMYSILKRLFRE